MDGWTSGWIAAWVGGWMGKWGVVGGWIGKKEIDTQLNSYIIKSFQNNIGHDYYIFKKWLDHSLLNHSPVLDMYVAYGSSSFIHLLNIYWELFCQASALLSIAQMFLHTSFWHTYIWFHAYMEMTIFRFVFNCWLCVMKKNLLWKACWIWMKCWDEICTNIELSTQREHGWNSGLIVSQDRHYKINRRCLDCIWPQHPNLFCDLQPHGDHLESVAFHVA